MVGIGNPDRQDDGVGWRVLDLLSSGMGGPAAIFPENEITLRDGAVVLHIALQLTPEMAEMVAQFERVCFVDAHTSEIEESLAWREIDPAFQTQPFTHHLTPSSCLALTEALYNSQPQALLVSIRGYEFGFSRDLSPATAQLAHTAAGRILDWLQDRTGELDPEGKNDNG